MDEAGIAALTNIIELSIAVNFEYSGAIIQHNNGLFSFTEPQTLNSDDSSSPNPVIPPGTTLVALYHTHGTKNHSNGAEKPHAERFSLEDMAICRLKNIYGYLGTPSKTVLKHIPAAFIDSSNPRKANYFGMSVFLTTIRPD